MSSAAVCPYCRAAVDAAEAVACAGCGTLHHAECLEENGGCTVFGCTHAPAVEPKLTIGAPDLQSSPAAGSAPPLPPPRPAPPPLVTAAPQAPVLAAPLFSSTGYNHAGRGAARRPASVQTAPLFPAAYPADARNRTAYVLLGILLGPLGIHSFYAGYNKRGLVQLLCTVLTLGLASFMIWIWAVIDVCTISQDAKGVPFQP